MSKFIPFKRYALVGLTALFLQTPLAHAAVLGIRPASASVAPGDSISLDLFVSELSSFAPDSLGAFDLYVNFDTAVLSFTGYSLGNLLGNVDLFKAIDVSTGAVGSVVNVAEVSLLSAAALNTAQPGEFILATLNFDVAARAIGTTTQLSFASGSVLGNAYGAPIALTRLEPAHVQVITSAVPVSGTLFLLTASLLSWLALPKRQSA